MNIRKAIAAANAALPAEIKIRFRKEWQVTYPTDDAKLAKRVPRQYCPAADYDDAVVTARDIAKRMGLSMRGDGPLTQEDYNSIASAFVSYGGYV